MRLLVNNSFPSHIEGIFFIWHYYDESCFSSWFIMVRNQIGKKSSKIYRTFVVSLSIYRFMERIKAVAVEDFEQTAQCLEEQIQHLIKNEPYILIGYSLGGRTAQYYALQARVKIGYLKAVILEGANLGLQSEQEKQSRLVNDNMWAERFFHEKPETVLEDWYQQPVFLINDST